MAQTNNIQAPPHSHPKGWEAQPQVLTDLELSDHGIFDTPGLLSLLSVYPYMMERTEVPSLIKMLIPSLVALGKPIHF